MKPIFKTKAFKFAVFLLAIELCLGIFCFFTLTLGLKDDDFGELQILGIGLLLGYSALLVCGVFAVSIIKNKLRRVPARPVSEADRERAAVLLERVERDKRRGVHVCDRPICTDAVRGLLRGIARGRRIHPSFKDTVLEAIREDAELYELLSNNIDETTET